MLNEKLPKNRLMRDHNVITIQIVCDNDMIAGLVFDSIKRQAIDGEFRLPFQSGRYAGAHTLAELEEQFDPGHRPH